MDKKELLNKWLQEEEIAHIHGWEIGRASCRERVY